MEDKDNAPNIHTADPVGMDRKSRQYNYIPVLKYSCTGMTACPHRLDRLLVQWPIDDSKINTLPIFISFIIYG